MAHESAVMGWLRGIFRPRGTLHPLEQAGAVVSNTPVPRIDDYGGAGDAQSAQFFALDGPTPAHVEWLFGLSDEWARTVLHLQQGVWRQGLTVEATHAVFCRQCGEGFDDSSQPCPTCGAVGSGAPPDQKERLLLEDFMHEANKVFGEGLVEVGERKTEETLKHGRGFIIIKQEYETNDTGVIASARLKGIMPGQSARIFPLRRRDGTPGGLFICIRCRQDANYKPEKNPGRCGCGWVLYEAHFAQHEGIMGGPITAYWMRSEVHETRWPYKDGSGPVRRLWPKGSALLMMDWYAAWALDPKRDKRPDRIFVTWGGDEASIKAWAKMNAAIRQKNPYALSHLHIPSPPGGLGDAKAGFGVADLGEKEFRGQMPELRKEFEAAMRKHYGVSSLTGGDTDEVGGLGQSKAPQLRTTADTIESIQKEEAKWLKRVAGLLGVTQWEYRFPVPHEEDEAKDAADAGAWLDVAVKAANAGLTVEWRGGRPVIQDGVVAKAAPPTFPPAFPEGLEEAMSELRQAVDRRADLTKAVIAELSGPSGAAAAADAGFTAYSGLTAEAGAAVLEEIATALSQPQGWSTQSIVDRIARHWVDAGFTLPEAIARAATVARTEARSIASEAKRRIWREEEAERGQEFRYHVRGADDARTTKQSHWIRSQIPEGGLALADVERILDEAVVRAVRGDFAQGGALSGVPGKPMRLPAGFRRRGFLTAFNDRDQVFRVA